MRPRSRLFSKRRLVLPTIREGAEEMVKDFNEANTLHNCDRGQAVSSEDYLLSICHLACPTSASTNVCSDNFRTLQQDAAQQRLRPSRLSGPLFSEKKLDGEMSHGNSDPLEYLYGHQNNLSGLSGSVGKTFAEGTFVRHRESVWESRAHIRPSSVTRALSPDRPHLCKSSSPDTCTTITTSVPNISPKQSLMRSAARRACPGDRGTEGQKQSLISQWISDCRSVWRVARVRACTLPAIAEV
ncbi:uncharacterized protein ACNS7B_012698 [Menidia menidia]